MLVSDYGTPTGGAELTTLTLRDELRRRGHDAKFFASSAGLSTGPGEMDYQCFGTTSRFRTLLQSANPWAAWKLRRVLDEFEPDIVHVTMFLTQLSPLILPLLRRTPSVYYAVWYRPVCPVGTKMLPDSSVCHEPYGTACLTNRCLPARDWVPLMLQMKLWNEWRPVFDRIVANSHATRRALVAQGIEPVDVIGSGIPARPARPRLPDSRVIAYAGRLVPEKGVDILIRAFAQIIRRMSDVRLLIAGDGPERERLQELADRLGVSGDVEFPGYQPRAGLEETLNTAWVQVVPSRWPEPFGLVTTEAMMRGTAVVASAAGGTLEIVEDGVTGFLFPSGDADSLADAVMRVLKDRDLAESMGRAGRAMALSQFSETACAEQFLHLYQSVL